MRIDARPQPTPENDDSKHVEEEPLEEAQTSIGERVQFWQEQDKINRALIPRVIRQKERLDKHIENHEDLAQIAIKEAQRLDEANLERFQAALRTPTRIALIAVTIGPLALVLSIIALVLSLR